MRSSTFEITNSAALERPAGGSEAEGGGGRAYVVGVEPEGEEDDSEGTVVWRERARWAESWRGMREARVSRAMTLASS